MFPRTTELHPDGFFRELDWRWREAHRLAEAKPWRRKPRPLDAGVLFLLGYLRSRDGSRRSRRLVGPMPDWSGVEGAVRLHTNAGSMKDEVKAHILAGESDADIGSRFGVSESTIKLYEIAFFCVRDRLHARDWITVRVIGRTFPPHDDARIWKHFAYHGGPYAFELVLAVTKCRPFPAEVRATFRIDPPYQEARLRLLVQLNISMLRASSFAEIAHLIDVYETARRTDLGRTDVPTALKNDLRKHHAFFSCAAAAESKAPTKPGDRKRKGAGQASPKAPRPSHRVPAGV